MSDKYDDCASCTFGGQDHAICDVCDEGDQWESAYEEDSAELTKVKVIKIHKKAEKVFSVELEKEAA
jgi:hypothetical protein